MATISEEIVAYESIQRSLENDRNGKWVVIQNKNLFDIYDPFENAAEDAVEQFGAGPFLIRKVGVALVTLPASVLYKPVFNDAAY